MGQLQRIVLVTGGLSLAGAATGAVSGALALAAVVALLFRVASPLDLLVSASAIGAGFGAIAAPSVAWLALRRVAIAHALLAIAIGSGIGGAVGVAIGASRVNPYEPFSLLRPPVPQGAIGALAGAIAAALIVRWRSGRVAASDRAV